MILQITPGTPFEGARPLIEEFVNQEQGERQLMEQRMLAFADRVDSQDVIVAGTQAFADGLAVRITALEQTVQLLVSRVSALESSGNGNGNGNNGVGGT